MSGVSYAGKSATLKTKHYFYLHTRHLRSILGPGVSQPAFIVNTYIAITEKAVGNTQSIATPVQTSTTRIRNSFIALNTQWEIGLNKFIGHIGKPGPQAVTTSATATTNATLLSIINGGAFHHRVTDSVSSSKSSQSDPSMVAQTREDQGGSTQNKCQKSAQNQYQISTKSVQQAAQNQCKTSAGPQVTAGQGSTGQSRVEQSSALHISTAEKAREEQGGTAQASAGQCSTSTSAHVSSSCLGQLREVQRAASWPHRQLRQARSAQRQVFCWRSAGSSRGNACARRAPRDEDQAATTVRSRIRQPSAVSVARSLGQLREVKRAASWLRRQLRQARSAQRQVFCGRSAGSSRGKACARRAP